MHQLPKLTNFGIFCIFFLENICLGTYGALNILNFSSYQLVLLKTSVKAVSEIRFLKKAKYFILNSLFQCQNSPRNFCDVKKYVLHSLPREVKTKFLLGSPSL